MRNVEATQANESLGQSARNLAGEPIVVTEDGVPIAALMPIDELDLESVALGNNPRFMAILEEARAQCQQGLGLSSETVRRELGLL
jgi:antitoxin (DNA-binding transcriptional repressor) of toxin-antitoxin stability system